MLLLMQVTHAFPAVLEKLELHAFDLCKMIEPFMRYEPSIPEDLKRHLHSIEEKIVECLAWEQGSSFYPQLVVAYEMNTDKQTGDKPEGQSCFLWHSNDGSRNVMYACIVMYVLHMRRSVCKHTV